MPTKRELERARDRISSFLELATEPGASYASQKAALTGIRRELRGVGASTAIASDLVAITSKTVSDPNFRAAYLINAALRMKESDRGHTQKVLSELDNYRKHVRADHQRAYGHQRLRAAMNSYGPIVGWYAVLDERTTPECREMHGKNFDPTEPPAAGLPGITHVNCRCRPGPPHETGQEVALSTVRSAPAFRGDVSMARTVELSDLNWSPRKNWVENKGGLPPYVVRIAKHLIAKGFSRSHAIATAINVVKKMKKTGDLNWPGRQRVNSKSRAEAVGSVARWEAMKASDTREGNRIDMARNYPDGYSVGHLPKFRSTAAPKTQRPGAAPGTIPSTDPKVRTPKGGNIERTTHGATPRGGIPQRVPVKSSAAKGHGASDATRASVRRVREAMAGARKPNAKQTFGMGPNTDAGVKMKRAMGYGGARVPSAGGQALRKKSANRQSAKGSAQAAPARSAASHWGMDLALPKPGQVAKTSNTERAKSIVKKIRSWGKPRKPKKFKTWKPTRI